MYVNGQYGYGWYNPKYFDSNGVLRQDYEYLSSERRKETQQIATEVVKELAPKIAAEIFNQAIDNLIGALEYDIEMNSRVDHYLSELLFIKMAELEECAKEIDEKFKLDA